MEYKTKRQLIRELLKERQRSAQNVKQLADLVQSNNDLDISQLQEESDALLSQLQLELKKNEDFRQRVEEQDLSMQTIIDCQMIDLNKKLDDISEENLCCICFNNWEAAGNHRLVSLKCGHLFGENCIFTFLEDNYFCPSCRQTAYIMDIRYVLGTTL
ncbi:E3 ubiquitin-protein ligase rnf8-B [Drosophila elegans]|uniref:E3 ubiquitin-protein ligase rnf8-B n=1 Tax=Drosophila elegans TaxID=30023 RepID=UPI001BC86459|nr:E3 ubiquitin-protein ligase rnf8-B [Drosophila elegans]